MLRPPLAQGAVGPYGRKRHLRVEGRGVPLLFVITGAHRHDGSQLEAVLDAIEVKRPASAQQALVRRCGLHWRTGT